MIFRLEIDTSNDAFDGSMWDVAIELRRLVNKAVDDFYPASAFVPNGGALLDVNGNTVGSWTYTPKRSTDASRP